MTTPSRPSLGNPVPGGHSLHPLVAERWSPRAFSNEPVSSEDLRALFEAARWAPSCFNEQPWRFLVATREQPEHHARLLGLLMEGNRSWAEAAPVLVIACADMSFARNGKSNRHASHDLGQALALLTVEATARGLAVHQMAGFDREAAAEVCSLPEGVEACTAFVVGKPGDADSLPADLAERERALRERKPLSETVFGSRWSDEPPLG
jgi:nitroreductase